MFYLLVFIVQFIFMILLIISTLLYFVNGLFFNLMVTLRIHTGFSFIESFLLYMKKNYGMKFPFTNQGAHSEHIF